jgi:hypothetical protein
MITIHVPFLWVEGLTFFPWVFYKQAHPPAWLVNHEHIHIRQQVEMGVLLFYAWYLLEFVVRLVQFRNINRAYRNIGFEREAYRNDEDLDYLTRRKFWAFWAYI